MEEKTYREILTEILDREGFDGTLCLLREVILERVAEDRATYWDGDRYDPMEETLLGFAEILERIQKKLRR